jgi:hypothetical protein
MTQIHNHFIPADISINLISMKRYVTQPPLKSEKTESLPAFFLPILRIQAIPPNQNL